MKQACIIGQRKLLFTQWLAANHAVSELRISGQELPKEVPRMMESQSPTTPEAGKSTVLLVEDETAVRALVRELLELGGYTVLEARDAAEALDLSGNYTDSIHLTVTDMIMPGMNGYELAQRMLQDRPQMKVLYMSGYTDGLMDQHEELAQGTTFLQKPFRPTDLVRKVRELLDAPVPA